MNRREAKKLERMQDMLLTLSASLAEAAKTCRDAGALGLAFSIYMVGESIEVYVQQVGKWLEKSSDA